MQHQLEAIAPHVHFLSHQIDNLSGNPNLKFPNIPLIAKTTDTETTFKITALLDSGATGLYIDKSFVDRHQLST